jgi:hypothetical protein
MYSVSEEALQRLRAQLKQSSQTPKSLQRQSLARDPFYRKVGQDLSAPRKQRNAWRTFLL